MVLRGELLLRVGALDVLNAHLGVQVRVGTTDELLDVQLVRIVDVPEAQRRATIAAELVAAGGGVGMRSAVRVGEPRRALQENLGERVIHVDTLERAPDRLQRVGLIALGERAHELHLAAELLGLAVSAAGDAHLLAKRLRERASEQLRDCAALVACDRLAVLAERCNPRGRVPLLPHGLLAELIPDRAWALDHELSLLVERDRSTEASIVFRRLPAFPASPAFAQRE